MANIKLTLQYDGSAYAGWQRQKGPLSIQEVVERTITVLTGQETVIHAAGRTDAGVHALHQVINFQSDSRIPIDRWPYALNSRLPSDIVTVAAEVVPDDWHARFTRHVKTYRYTLDNRPFPSPLLRRYAWHRPDPLDTELMNHAAQELVGWHDFSSFRAAGSSVQTSTRLVLRAEWSRQGPEMHFFVQANGFLYNMVRIMVGTLVDVGSGRRQVEDVRRLLDAKDRRQASLTAPAEGLCLLDIDYNCQDPRLDSGKAVD